jgi:hypothetical protein
MKVIFILVAILMIISTINAAFRRREWRFILFYIEGMMAFFRII